MFTSPDSQPDLEVHPLELHPVGSQLSDPIGYNFRPYIWRDPSRRNALTRLGLPLAPA